ncbi:LysR substrate-binding domain-containing protein, partial [Streptomyces sp. NPDC000851]
MLPSHRGGRRDALDAGRALVTHRLEHAPPWPDTVATTMLLREPLDVAMPSDHPLAAKRRVTPRDVADEPWVTVQTATRKPRPIRRPCSHTAE